MSMLKSQRTPDYLLDQHKGDKALLTPEELARVAVLEKQEFDQRGEWYRLYWELEKGPPDRFKKRMLVSAWNAMKAAGAGDDLADRAGAGPNAGQELSEGTVRYRAHVRGF
jgi:hypothetical protein